MSSSMDKSPGYETRDANTRGVLGFLIVLGIVLVFTAIVCWGMLNIIRPVVRVSLPLRHSAMCGNCRQDLSCR